MDSFELYFVWSLYNLEEDLKEFEKIKVYKKLKGI